MTILDIETIPAWPLTQALRDALSAEAERREEPVDDLVGLCPMFARIVCVGLYHVSPHRAEDGTTRAWMRLLYDKGLMEVDEAHPDLHEAGCVAHHGEASILKSLDQLIKVPMPLVTFNGRRFDLPAIWHRSRINDIEPSTIVVSALQQKPWEHRPHVDLMQVASFDRAMATYSMRMHCIAYGLDDPKAGMDGKGVAELVRDSNGTDVLRYNRRDLLATAGLAQRIL